jgi:hypothetical protein
LKGHLIVLGTEKETLKIERVYLGCD